MGTTWTSPTIISSGSSGGSDISAINRSRTALRQIWKKSNNQIAVYNSGLQKSDNVEKFVATRLNKHIIFNLESTPALRGKGYKGMIAFEIAGLSKQTTSGRSSIEIQKKERALHSNSFLVGTNNEVLKLAGAFYAKGLELPEKGAFNELSDLFSIQLKDASTDEVIREVWSVPFSRLVRATKTDGEFRTLNISLNKLQGKNVYLDVETAAGVKPIFVDDYYILDKEDAKMKKFFEEEAVKVPTQYALHQNYPNPFNPSTTISFDLVEPNNVTLKIYNSIG